MGYWTFFVLVNAGPYNCFRSTKLFFPKNWHLVQFFFFFLMFPFIFVNKKLYLNMYSKFLLNKSEVKWLINSLALCSTAVGKLNVFTNEVNNYSWKNDIGFKSCTPYIPSPLLFLVLLLFYRKCHKNSIFVYLCRMIGMLSILVWWQLCLWHMAVMFLSSPTG